MLGPHKGLILFIRVMVLVLIIFTQIPQRDCFNLLFGLNFFKTSLDLLLLGESTLQLYPLIKVRREII